MADFRYNVTTEDDGFEVREIIRKHFDFSARLRNKIKREKLVFLNGAQTEGWIRTRAGDVVEIRLPEEASRFEPQNIPLSVVYEDDDLLIIDKQPGITVHPTKGHPSGTIANALMHYMEKTGHRFKIRFINRLDMDTSGLLVVAKNAYCQNHYTKQMKDGSVEKRYISIVKGVVENESGAIDLPIGRPDPESVKRGVMEGGATSLTRYTVLERFPSEGYTLVELLLETGRTHQIRVHMSHIGHPVLGDALYGGENPLLTDRQALHAARLSFTHPITKKRLRFEAPLPDDMKRTIEKLRRGF